MWTNASAADARVFSTTQRFRRVLALLALFMAASLNAMAQITVAPASLTFTAKQIVGTTSSSKAVTISNSGGSAQ
ncbi:MAG: hypothetical protein ABSA80_19865, partial [Terriglobales bacterium]